MAFKKMAVISNPARSLLFDPALVTAFRLDIRQNFRCLHTEYAQQIERLTSPDHLWPVERYRDGNGYCQPSFQGGGNAHVGKFVFAGIPFPAHLHGATTDDSRWMNERAYITEHREWLEFPSVLLGVGQFVDYPEAGVLCFVWSKGDKNICDRRRTSGEMFPLTAWRFLPNGNLIFVGCFNFPFAATAAA